VKEETLVAPVEKRNEVVSDGVNVVATDYVCFGTFDGDALECNECQFKVDCAKETQNNTKA